MARRTCRVLVKGLKEEAEHEVTVEADTLYEAAVRGLAALRQGSWSADDAEATACVVVTVQPPAVSHRVKVTDLTAWLEGSGKSPADRLERQRLRALLQGKPARLTQAARRKRSRTPAKSSSGCSGKTK